MTRSRTGLLLLVLTFIPPAAHAAAVRLDDRIDLNVTDADVGKLFQTVGQLTGARVDLDPRFQTARRISIRIDNVTLRTALTAICESLGCRWRTRDGAIFVEPVRTGDPSVSVLDAKIDLKITGADLAFDEALPKAKLSLELEQETVAATLDAACAQAGCKWKLVNRDPKPMLQIGVR
jgi:hypothetical protein